MTNPYAEGFLYHDVGRQYQRVAHWALTDGATIETRLAQLAQQIKGFFIDLTEDGGQSFSNHFARMSYVAQAAQVDSRLTYYLHQFDREAARHLRGEEARLSARDTLTLGAKALVDLIEGVLGLTCERELAELLPEDFGGFRLQEYVVAEYKPQLRVLILENLEARRVLRVRLTDAPGLDHYVHYGREGYNARFVGAAVRLIAAHFTLPLEANLLAVEIDADGELNPQHLVVEPDFLVDVTAIAKCFDPEGAEPMKYLLGRLTPFTSSVAMMAGNVANHFLDEAVTAAAPGSFRDSFAATFPQSPLQYALLGDDDLRDLIGRCEGHHRVIGDCVARHFPDQAIPVGEVAVEPTFYSERYGIQGRLDVFLPPSGSDAHAKEADAAIVELKSGRVFRPNQHRVNVEHYVQTLLYDLLVRSVYADRVRPRNFVLYSGDREAPLRYAPPNRAQQYEALAVRNNMMAIERLLCASRPGAPGPLDWLRPDRYPNLSGFVRRDLEAFYAAYAGLSELERDYLRAYVGFVAREQRMAKVGAGDAERLSGQAVLWRDDLETKLDGYGILHDLKLQTVASTEGYPVLTLTRPPAEGEGPALTSFRRGDIVVLYAGDARRRAILRGQVFKATITLIDAERVTVRLRASQPDLTRFEEPAQWNLEPDLFDSAFTRLYRNLAEFAAAPRADRERVLGLRPPAEPGTARVTAPTALTEEQAGLFRAIVNARDYYLLWGPPGTGKTSVMLHHLCDHFVNRTRERLLVLAFTNRAVDEICRAIAQLGGDITRRYLRIGSAYGCEAGYRAQLLQQRIQTARTRQEIRELLAEQRIVVGTVSSVLGKGEALFELLRFDRLIVDEASQLLEPQLVNLLTRFPRTVLIGDHRQLPAVVTQAATDTQVDDKGLRGLGITDLRNSLFERLYERCQVQGWDWAYGQLTRQGRMHRSIAEYADRAFYGGTLRCLGVQEASLDWQQLPCTYEDAPADCSAFERMLCERTLVTVDTPVDLSDKAFRTNGHEAEAVVAAIRSLVRIRAAAHVTLKPDEIGVITPYRAQIARIRAALLASDLAPEWDAVNVDTVERYQGASYRIVLLSLCANQPSAVGRLSSYAAGTMIDRKLNVALTRARERVVAFGNVELLRGHNAAYRDFIDHCEETGGLYAPALAADAAPADGSLSAAETEELWRAMGG